MNHLYLIHLIRDFRSSHFVIVFRVWSRSPIFCALELVFQFSPHPSLFCSQPCPSPQILYMPSVARFPRRSTSSTWVEYISLCNHVHYFGLTSCLYASAGAPLTSRPRLVSRRLSGPTLYKKNIRFRVAFELNTDETRNRPEWSLCSTTTLAIVNKD